MTDATHETTRPLGEPYLSITHDTAADTVTITDSSSPTDKHIPLSKHQAVTVRELLNIGDGTLPEYHGSRTFTITGIRTHDDRLTITGTSTPTLVFRFGDDTEIVLPPASIATLYSTLTAWGFTFDAIDSTVLTLPGMIELDDGISEPLLHEAFDHILEYYYTPVGYWSPKQNDYVHKR